MIVFLLGTGRCGSSLVHEVLARHEGVGFISNVEDRTGRRVPGRANNRLYRKVPERLTRKGAARFAPSEGYRLLRREVSPLLVDPVRDPVEGDLTPWLAQRLRAFFESRSAEQGLPVFSHKFTGWPRAGLLHAALPEARFVNVVRDGRAVANSLLQMPWWGGYAGPATWRYGPLPDDYAQEWAQSGQSFPVLAAITWKVLMDAFEEVRLRIPRHLWLDLHYEDLLADPRREVQRLLDFLELSWSEVFDQGYRAHRIGAGRRDAFRQDLSPEDLTAVEASLGRHLGRWGYPRQG